MNNHKNNYVNADHRADLLIKAAKVYPTLAIRDSLIDLEIDANGQVIGYQRAVIFWNKAIPDKNLLTNVYLLSDFMR